MKSDDLKKNGTFKSFAERPAKTSSQHWIPFLTRRYKTSKLDDD